MTSFGDAVLLLTYEGTIFSARSADSIIKTRIETPDNGYSGYVETAKLSRYSGYVHHFDRLRYNDILHYESASQHGLAIAYTEFVAPEECYRNAVAILALDPAVDVAEQIVARKEDWNVIYRSRPCLPLKKKYAALEGEVAGGRMAFKAPATIYMGNGDFHWDGLYGPGKVAQDPAADYGKVMAIDLVSHQSRIVSSGHRNPQGIVFDRGGNLWVVEHGMRGGDELNRIVEGANYGWPEETLGTLYNGLPIPGTRSFGRHDTFTAPTFAWLPSVGISNLALIEDFHPSWDGDILMASMNYGSLYRIRIKDERVVFAEKIPIGTRIRYAHFLKGGHLVLWTDDAHLMFLSVSKKGFTNDFINDYFARAPYDDQQRGQVRAALDGCLRCHSFVSAVNEKAPSLAAIFKARIASGKFKGYSAALRHHSGNWSRSELMAFLADPQAFAPGTSMPDPGIDDPYILGELTNILEATRTKIGELQRHGFGAEAKH